VVTGEKPERFVAQRREAPKGTDVDLGDAVLLPGLVNAHTHLELTAMRGFLEGLDFVSWIRQLTAARAAVLDEAAMLDSARVGIAEGLQAGITTYADTCSSGVALQAMRELGVRGIMYQEVFGPVAPVMRVRDDNEAIEVANATEYGLGSNLWTQDLNGARELARRIEAGGVFINGMTASDPRLPFGGVKRSGHGRELAAFGIHEFTNVKTVWIGPADGQQPQASAAE